MKIGLWNCNGIHTAVDQLSLVESLANLRIHIGILSETWLKGRVDGLPVGDRFIYSFGPPKGSAAREGVGFCVSAPINPKVKFVPYTPRVASLKVNMGKPGKDLTLIAAYSPTEDKCLGEHQLFLASVQRAIDDCGGGRYMVGGDFNCRIGQDSRIFEPGVKSPVGRNTDEGATTLSGHRLVELCLSNGLLIANSFYRHQAMHSCTWYHPRTKNGSVKDFFWLVRR
jgi:hypothetical protein